MHNSTGISLLQRVARLRMLGCAFCVGLLAPLGASVHAQVVPSIITFQGMLSDAVGDPIAGTRSVEFSLYEDSLGGSPVWNESKDVLVENGLFATYLGSTNPLDPSLFTGQALFVGVKVESDPEMQPRRRLATVPYAFKAYDILCPLALWYQDADEDNFGDESGLAIACTVPAGYVADKTDCDDSVSAVNPFAVETCDAVDNDCDGTVNEGDLCDDGDVCTFDLCDTVSGCTFTPIDCNDANECTTDSCDPSGGCMNVPVADGGLCTGGTCQSGICQ